MESLYLRSAGRSLLIDLSAPEPAFIHWGADLGEELPELALLQDPVPPSSLDIPVRMGLLPQASSGWRGRPGLRGSRDGRDFSPRLRLVSAERTAAAGCVITQSDPGVGLSVRTELLLNDGGLLQLRHELTNDTGLDYRLEGLELVLPAGPGAAELLDLTGRWCRERHPQRRPLQQGTWVRSGRHGRTGHDSSLVLAAGSAGFSNRAGEVWALHLGWSGNHETFADTLASGHTVLGAGELLAPGEVTLAAGSSYRTPWLYAAYSDRGLDGITESFYGWFRNRPHHPARPRPVVLNTWEAVYFDHNLDVLMELAESGADLGVERFVLDDGWFRGRRDDTKGLGDWYVDEAVWPDGLTPLINGVTERGMEFGLWVEPEMVNEDSDIIRAHPDWISGPADPDGPARVPERWRNQQVLDLANPAAWDYIHERLNTLLNDNNISYLKWDQNRDLTEMGHGGKPSVHAQTKAVYRLMDTLRAAHPGVEIESCSSGGARVDLGILERTDRIWTSDCNDALERQTIQRWTELIIPPELVGAHVGPTTSHTTHRRLSLSFRALTALFGHFGMEWDVRTVTGEEREELKQVIGLYKQYRHLIHTGRAINSDHPDPSLLLRGVISEDTREGLFTLAALATSRAEMPGPVCLPGLEAKTRYRVEVLYPTAKTTFTQAAPSAWSLDGVEATGQFLAHVGLPMPNLNPEHAILIAANAL
ncbi:alpha-galactosidase [Arthrobacter sp. ISL-48]|uniref:alpha-galactosidase n=1 Tax=Arthrobacter sp. ISL-48 TaxID=2819110 RepID=UPI001BE7855C|nr:alpha-galactosidase [Arthrobacter sp. ISL-48]MBT2533842.1 alpha-galactosidase [Arthrobacter sp. ISL-48]